MKRPTFLLIAFGVVFVGTAIFWWGIFALRRSAREIIAAQANSAPPATAVSLPAPRSVRAPAARPTRPLTAAEKTARIEQIRHDYDEIRTKAANDYRTAGEAFPGGLNGFLRQLALLEREKHNDLAAILTPQELEDVEMRDTHAGEAVQKWLGDTPTSDDQRRSVFRLQQAFDDKYALSFDSGPVELAARERDRQALQEQVRSVLGDALFGSWLRAEGGDYGAFATFATQHALPPTVPIDLWHLRNAYLLGRLQLDAEPSLSPEQMQAAQDALAAKTEAAVRVVLGPGAPDASRDNILNWLQK